MKTILTTAIAGLMLLGVAAGVASPNNHGKKSAPALFSDAGPAPCYPGPGCTPPIPRRN